MYRPFIQQTEQFFLLSFVINQRSTDSNASAVKLFRLEMQGTS